MRVEEARPCTSSTKQVHNHHAGNIPDVPKGVNFLMEHLNDQNFDRSRLGSYISVVEEESTRRYVGEDGNGVIDFNE